MFKHTTIAGSLAILVLTAASLALGGIPDLGNSIVTWAYEGEETLSLMNLPDGTGHTFDRAFLPGTADGGPGTFVDATITLTLLDGGFTPIAYFPREDLWLDSADPQILICTGGSIADSDSDELGRTRWRYPLRAGGWSEAVIRVFINGDAVIGGDLPLHMNSPDINADGVVNLSDVGYFASDYFTTYHYRSDFNYDGALNLSDVGYLSAGRGAQCP